MPMKVRYNVLDGEIVSENRAGTQRDYVPDALGSTVALLDENQARTDTFEYWPYGERRARDGTTPTPFQFVGSLGIHRDAPRRAYVRGRHLAVSHARWLTPDPTSPDAEANLYWYCLDSPVSYLDSTGLAPRGAPRPMPAQPFPWPG